MIENFQTGFQRKFLRKVFYSNHFAMNYPVANFKAALIQQESISIVGKRNTSVIAPVILADLLKRGLRISVAMSFMDQISTIVFTRRSLPYFHAGRFRMHICLEQTPIPQALP